ncbi:MAG: hypothetical protein PHQ65_16565 [Bacteroidales bacterium]|nr:hypothetical protein [Bacteroidales bacterium]
MTTRASRIEADVHAEGRYVPPFLPPGLAFSFSLLDSTLFRLPPVYDAIQVEYLVLVALREIN